MSEAGILHYPGRVTDIRPGQRLGCDAAGRPYAVLSVEYSHGRTTVFLTYPTTAVLQQWEPAYVIRGWLDHLERRRQAEAAHVRTAPDGWLTAMAARQSAWAGRGAGGAV